MMRIVIPFLMVMAVGCGDSTQTPKPRAYPRVEYPKHEMQSYNSPDCPFTFEFPAYAKVELKPDHACWFDLTMPVFNARLYCSYLPVKDRAEYDDLVEDVFTIATKINARANYMEERPLLNPNGVGGLALTWTGAAASPLHFFLTDTTTHFFKAALYFEAEVKPDSIAPIASFVEEDIQKMISSFRWK